MTPRSPQIAALAPASADIGTVSAPAALHGKLTYAISREHFVVRALSNYPLPRDLEFARDSSL